MTTVSGGDGIRAIDLEQLCVSHTGSQDERRKHFNKAAITELAESIKTVGLLSPIIARPAARIDVVESDSGGRWYPAYKRKSIDGHNLIGGGHATRKAAETEADELRAKQEYEIVAGERRFVAAKQAGLAAINVWVRTLTDEQVLEVQLVENLQREGLHELAEAEGYEALLNLGHSADEIAEKVGKSRGYVYSRMKLLALCSDARKAFYDGTLNASTALLLARIPVESLQVKALKDIANPRWGGETMSVREAQDLIHRDYMLQLSEAKFDTADEALVPGTVACGRCPKNTLSQPELFGDVKKGGSAGVCTDPGCFKAKREAAADRQIADAKAKGLTVITGKAAKEIIPHHGDWINGQVYAKPGDRCQDDPKNRTYGQILGKGADVTLIQSPHSGDLIKLVKKNDAVRKLKADGVVTPAAKNKAKTQSEKSDGKLELAYRAAVFKAIIAKAPAKLGRHEIEACALALFNMGYGDDEPLFELLGWEVKNASFTKGEKYFVEQIKSASDSVLAKIICTLLYRDELDSTHGTAPVLTGEAKRLGIDTAKIKAAVKAELAAAAPKAVKKAAGKKK